MLNQQTNTKKAVPKQLSKNSQSQQQGCNLKQHVNLLNI